MESAPAHPLVEERSAKRRQERDEGQQGRLVYLEQEVKRLRAKSKSGSVDNALAQVRHLSARASVENSVLMAAVEHLVDSATLSNHPEKEAYMYVHYYKACRELENGPGLRRLVITLGDSTAKRVSQALESVKRAEGASLRASSIAFMGASTLGIPRPIRSWPHCPIGSPMGPVSTEG